jgi:hypothetical protein
MKRQLAAIAEDLVAQHQNNASERLCPDNEKQTILACSGVVDACDNVARTCSMCDAKQDLPGRFPGAERYQGSEMAMIRASRAKGRRRF